MSKIYLNYVFCKSVYNGIFMTNQREKCNRPHFYHAKSFFIQFFSDFGVKYTQLTNLSFFFTIPNFHKKTMNK